MWIRMKRDRFVIIIRLLLFFLFSVAAFHSIRWYILFIRVYADAVREHFCTRWWGESEKMARICVCWTAGDASK